MNKKMTRVIGIVAVLMLLMVACVGAASAQVDVYLEVTEDQFDKSGGATYGWYESAESSTSKATLTLSNAMSGTLTYDSNTHKLTLSDGTNEDSAVFCTFINEVQSEYSGTMHFRYLVYGGDGYHTMSNTTLTNVTGSTSGGNYYKIYAMNGAVSNISINGDTSGQTAYVWFKTNTSGTGEANLNETYTGSIVKARFDSDNMTLILTDGLNDSTTYYLSAGYSYSKPEAGLYDIFISKTGIYDYTSHKLGNTDIELSADSYTVSIVGKDWISYVYIYDTDGNKLTQDTFDTYFDGRVEQGSTTSKWGATLNSTSASPFVINNYETQISQGYFNRNGENSDKYELLGTPVIFNPNAVSAGQVSLKSAYKIKKVQVAFGVNSIFDEPHDMTYANDVYTYDNTTNVGFYTVIFNVYLDYATKTVNFAPSTGLPSGVSWSTSSGSSGKFDAGKSYFRFIYNDDKNLDVYWVNKNTEPEVATKIATLTLGDTYAESLGDFTIKVTEGSTGTPVTVATVNAVKNATNSTMEYAITSATEPDGYTVGIAYTAGSKVTLTYNPNGGVGLIKTVEKSPGDTVTVNQTAYNWDNTGTSTNTQTGWNTSADGTGTSYSLTGSSFTINEDTTLYAVWNFRTNSQDSTVKMITDPTFTFTIPSEVILSNTLNGIVGAKVGINPDTSEGKFKTEKNIVMRLNTDALTGTITGTTYEAYDTFDVTPEGIASSSRETGKFADYKLNVYTNEGLSTKLKSVNGKNNTASPKNNDVISVLGTNSDGVTAYLGYVTDKLPTYADTYTDTLNFIVSVEDSTQATEKTGYFNVYGSTSGETPVDFTKVTINSVLVDVDNTDKATGTSVGTLKAGTEYMITKTSGVSFNNVMPGGSLTVYNGTTSKSVEYTITDDNTITFSLSVEDIAAMRDGADNAYNIRLYMSSSA